MVLKRKLKLGNSSVATELYKVIQQYKKIFRNFKIYLFLDLFIIFFHGSNTQYNTFMVNYN